MINYNVHERTMTYQCCPLVSVISMVSMVSVSLVFGIFFCCGPFDPSLL